MNCFAASATLGLTLLARSLLDDLNVEGAHPEVRNQVSCLREKSSKQIANLPSFDPTVL